MQQGNENKWGEHEQTVYVCKGCSGVYLYGALMGLENTPVAFAQTHWGWSQPGQAPGTAGGLHTQTDCLVRSLLGQGPPWGPG